METNVMLKCLLRLSFSTKICKIAKMSTVYQNKWVSDMYGTLEKKKNRQKRKKRLGFPGTADRTCREILTN